MLRKLVTITNNGSRPWNRLLNVRLGRYDVPDAPLIDRPAGGTYSVPAPREFPSSTGTHVERGFPVFAGGEFFFALAHPAGAAEGSGGKVSLRQYPGATLAPGKTFACMEAVYGAAKTGAARQAFLAHVQSRMRRVVRGHDKPYAVFEPFGARPDGNSDESEEFLLDNLAKVAQGQREAGCHFDLYSVDFWVDYRGTLKECDPQRFPHGLTRIRRELDKLGTAMGLWIDGSMEGWSIGGNPTPAVQACLNFDTRNPESLKLVQLGRKAFCRAAEPIRSMYTEAFRHHIRQNGVRLLKFDNTGCVCVNPNHGHLPGLYSTEAIEDSLIDFFRALDAECPDVFLMLYWGYKSPWWLLHADTLFDSGIGIEAASPSDQPTPYVRDGITQKLDQAQWAANENVPPLGKDSLGVWLSDWPWNSQVGKERWEDGFVMDICRGSLLAQPWSDTPWLSPPQRKQMAEFIALLKAQPGCFANSRFILGDPWKDEPYGYCCTDGKRALLAIHNCCWKDSVLRLELNAAWGLPDGKAWDLYRWHPDRAKLSGQQAVNGNFALDEFRVAASPRAGQGDAVSVKLRNARADFSQETYGGWPVAAALDGDPKSGWSIDPLEGKPHVAVFETQKPVGFQGGTALEVVLDQGSPAGHNLGRLRLSATTAKPPFAVPKPAARSLVVKGRVPASPSGGMLVVTVEMKRGSHPMAIGGPGKSLQAQGTLAGRSAAWTPVLGTATYPACWQAWRVEVGPSRQPQAFDLAITAGFGPDVELTTQCHFLPK